MSTNPRPIIRVWFDDESSWGEHIEDNLYRSLNDTFSNVMLKLPEGHEAADKNGQPCRLAWGHIFEGEVIRKGVVRPLFIFGVDKFAHE